MGWNYRVIRHSDEKTKSFWFHIHEVYYSDDGEIEGWTQNPKIPVGDSAEDLKGEIELIIEAFNRPVLKEENNALIEKINKQK